VIIRDMVDAEPTDRRHDRRAYRRSVLNRRRFLELRRDVIGEPLLSVLSDCRHPAIARSTFGRIHAIAKGDNKPFGLVPRGRHREPAGSVLTDRDKVPAAAGELSDEIDPG